MATTYKFLTTGTETLTANVFADQVEIYDGHRLDPCTMYVWFHDDLLGNADSITQVQGPIRIGAGGNTYDVDLSSVANSGEYYCEIRVGETGDCWFTTERRRVTIVECLDQVDRTFGPTGASGSFRVNAPHYETPIFNNDGNDWINADGIIACDTATENVCLFVQNFTLDDQTSANNQARRGQPTITVGELVCYYNTVQDYLRTQDSDGVVADQPAGPFINLSQNGPANIGGTIRITAEVGTIGGTGSESYEVDFGDGFSSLLTHDVTSNVAQIQTITATVRDNNGQTATESIQIEHITVMISPTTVTGNTISSINSAVIWFRDPTTSTSGTFTVTGGGTFFIRLTLLPTSFFGGRAGNYEATLNLRGPGGNRTEVISTTTAAGEAAVTREIEISSGVGTYSWDFTWTDGLTRPETSGANRNNSQATFFAAGQLY